MSIEQWLLAGAAATTVAFFAVAIYSPSTFDPDPDWSVSEGCLSEGHGSAFSEHYHPSLKVTMDGQQLQIPGNTGIDQTGCLEGMRWIHVHTSSDSGYTTLHIETPGKLNVPLGAFFQVWDREGGPGLTDDRNFDIDGSGVSDWDEYDITMLVNGDENTKYESFVMEDLDQIELIFTSK